VAFYLLGARLDRVPDSLEGLGHGVLAPGRGVAPAELDALPLAAPVQRPRRYAELGGGALHGGLAGPDGLERPVKVGRRPGGRARVERGREPDALPPRDLVEGARGYAEGLGGLVRGDGARAQGVQGVVQALVAPGLGRAVLLRGVDAKAMGPLPEGRRRYAEGRCRRREPYYYTFYTFYTFFGYSFLFLFVFFFFFLFLL
jgi:hypothetical protein